MENFLFFTKWNIWRGKKINFKPYVISIIFHEQKKKFTKFLKFIISLFFKFRYKSFLIFIIYIFNVCFQKKDRFLSFF